MQTKRISDNFSYTPRSSMRDIITLMQPNPVVQAADGTPMPPIVFMSNVWAKINMWRSGKELDVKERAQAEVFYLVTTPYIVGVNTTMTVIMPNGSTGYIVNVADPDQRQVELRYLVRVINDGIV